ncbi:uncharacterized protein LOC124309321 [Neodiprion virginianus]|uniref:uncharacterized protein LOC124309321 n=1 Tax=Neodiprion virginianus TaxID=2961670 RepID=UPI001EE72377|nr:uncharacterized protein LOC124309321 [Neodiprion virginianus]
MCDNKDPLTSGSVEKREEQFNDEKRGIFTNALRHAFSIYESRSLISENPPALANADAIAIGECIANETIRILQEYVIVHDEDLISYHEPNKDKAYKACTFNKDEIDPFFNLADYQATLQDYVPLDYKKEAVTYAKIHPNYSLEVLQASGFSRLETKDDLKEWADDIEKGGTRLDKLLQIDSETIKKFEKSRSIYEQVTTRTLQLWATAIAFPLLSENFSFVASTKWVKYFKRKHGIRQRKITKFLSKNEVATFEETVKAAGRFQTQVTSVIGN